MSLPGSLGSSPDRHIKEINIIVRAAHDLKLLRPGGGFLVPRVAHAKPNFEIFLIGWELAMARDELQRILNRLEPLVTDRIYDCKESGQTVEELHEFLNVPRAYVLSVLKILGREGLVRESGDTWKVVDPNPKP